MVTVSSVFISSRRERIIFRVLSASGCAFKAAACVDVLRALGKTDLDNTGVARDHSFHCIANAESRRPGYTTHVGLTVSTFQCGVLSLLCLPAAVRVPQAGRRQVQFQPGEEDPGRRALVCEPDGLIFGQAVAAERLRR